MSKSWYRKPQKVEAIQLDSSNAYLISDRIGGTVYRANSDYTGAHGIRRKIYIAFKRRSDDRGGTDFVMQDEWVVFYDDGNYVVYKDDFFQENFEYREEN